MLRLFAVFCVALTLSLSLTGCGRGWRDSLVLTGLRGKPDESRIVMHEPLVLPSSDEAVLPNSRTSADALRGNVYKVHEILYGQELATQEAQRQLEASRQGGLSATEAHLLQQAQSVATGTEAVPEQEARKKRWFRFPKLFGRK